MRANTLEVETGARGERGTNKNNNKKIDEERNSYGKYESDSLQFAVCTSVSIPIDPHAEEQ